MKKCTECSCGLRECRGTYHFEPPENIPGGNISIENAVWYKCNNCKTEVLTRDLSKSIQHVTIIRQGLLTPEEIKNVRDKRGLTQVQMASQLGVGDKTYTRWEAGRSIQNRSSDNVIRLFDRDPEAFLAINAQRKPERSMQVLEYIEGLSSINTSEMAMAAHDAKLEEKDVLKIQQVLRKKAQQK